MITSKPSTLNTLLTLGLGLLILSGCSRQYKVAKITPGQTTLDETFSLLDEPLVGDHSNFENGSEIYIWDDVSVQARDGIVSAVHRKPAGHEKTLQFWKQHYKDVETKLEPVQTQGAKGELLWQLTIPSQGLNVVYNERNDSVIRVTKYAME